MYEGKELEDRRDQRADTPLPEPRTKAGQAMESWLREPEDYAWGRKVTDAILAIEAEAAAEPAAAEPVLREAADWILQIGLPAGAETWRPEYEALLAKIDAALGAAQPPRGSLPPGHWEIDSYGERHWIEDEAGGSLTATAQATPSDEPPDGH